MLRLILRRFARLGLQRRIMLYVSAGLVAFSAIYGFVALQAIQQSSDLVFRERLLVARALARQLDGSLAHIQGELEETGATVAPGLAANNHVAAQDALRTLSNHWISYHDFGNPCILSLTDASGTVLWSQPSAAASIGRHLEQTLHLQDVFQLQRPRIVDDAAPDTSDNPMVLLAVPLQLNQKTIGFIVGEIDRGHMGSTLEPDLSVIDPGYAVELIDSSGLVIASNQKAKQLAESHHRDLVAPLLRAGESGVRTHTFEEGGQEHSHVVAFAPLTQIQWGVIVEQEVDEAFILPHNLQIEFVGFGLLALFGGLALAWLTTRTVVRPVNALTNASEAIARGDLDHPLDISGADEVGALARSFDEMRIRLQASRQEIARWNRELEARVHQRTRELSALVESSHALTSTLDLDTLFGILMQQTREVVPSAEGSVLFLLDPERPRLVVRSAFGFDADQCGQLFFESGEAIGGRVFETLKPMLLKTAVEVESAQANLSEENRRHFQEAVGDREALSAVGVPLMAKGARLGSLVLYSFSRAAAFAESDVPILQALADQAAAAIENAQLYTALQAKEAARSQLLEKVIEAQEEERQRVAREIHDELGQLLTRLSINLKMCESHIPAELTEATQNLAATQTLVWQTIEQAHRLIVELRPTLLDELGLEAALREELAQRLTPLGVETALTADGALERLPTPVGIAVFRIAQEAISNIARHAHAQRISLSLHRDAYDLQVLIQDDGIGLPADWRTRTDGHRPLGLLGMQERAALLGGTLTVEPDLPRGTRVMLRVPLEAHRTAGESIL